MSRIGKKPISIPSAVKIELKDNIIRVEGSKGKLEEKLSKHVEMELKDGVVTFTRKSDEIPARAAHGTMRSKLENMIKGVTEGYKRELVINGVGYKAEIKGQTIDLYVGFSGPKPYTIPAGIQVALEDKNTKVIITGIDKQLVGKVAAEIRKIRPPEPYKEKGIKYSDEYVKRKVGKSAVGQGAA